MLSGGLICGYFSDLYGRRSALLYSLGINSLAGILSAFSPDVTWLIVFRLVAGLGIGGSVPAVFSLGAELFPSAVRGKQLSIVASFWMVGAIYTAIAGWVMLGDDFQGNRIIPQTNWRWFAGVSVLPAIGALVFTYFTIPESPRFLVSKKRYKEAAQVSTS